MSASASCCSPANLVLWARSELLRRASNRLVTFKSVDILIFADALQAGPFPTLTLGLPSMAALAADVGHLCNPTSVAHIRCSRNIPAFKL